MSTYEDRDNHVADLDAAREVIDALGLTPHPEGGYFRETWRDRSSGNGRGHGTAIYFLLEGGQRSHWHRVDATEIWHWYAGAPLDVLIAAADGGRERVRLGPDVRGGERPQAIVPAGAWQSTEAPAGWGLVGCTVSPAFEFDGFELAPPGWSPP